MLKGISCHNYRACALRAGRAPHRSFLGTGLCSVFGAAHGVGRVQLQDLAGDQPVKQDAKRRQVLLDGGRGQLALQVLNESGDVDRCTSASCLIWCSSQQAAKRRAAFK